MTAEIRSELEQLRIHVDSWMRQADIEAEIPRPSSGSRPTRRRGRCGRATTQHGDDKDRPLVRSADGSYLYYAADIAYVLDKL